MNDFGMCGWMSCSDEFLFTDERMNSWVNLMNGLMILWLLLVLIDWYWSMDEQVVYMDEWMDEWIDRCMREWIDEWVIGCMGEWWMNELMGLLDALTKYLMTLLMDGWMNWLLYR